MTYTVQDVDRIVVAASAYGFEGFQGLLGAAPFILFGDIGIAMLVEDQGPELDSRGGDYCTSALWYVFAIVDPTGAKRYFKRDGHYQSHCGTEWYDTSIEVHDAVVTKRSWEPIA